MDILINGEGVDALSTITHKDFAYARGKAVVENFLFFFFSLLFVFHLT